MGSAGNGRIRSRGSYCRSAGRRNAGARIITRPFFILGECIMSDGGSRNQRADWGERWGAKSNMKSRKRDYQKKKKLVVQTALNWSVVWTACLFIATIASAVVLLRTDNTLKDQAAITGRQLAVMESQQRAWINYQHRRIDRSERPLVSPTTKRAAFPSRFFSLREYRSFAG